MPERDLLEELESALQDYIDTVADTKTVFIATLDGHLLLEKNTSEYPLNEVVPMAGSVLGILETLATQVLSQGLDDNIVIMRENVLGLFKIHDKEDTLFLGILCDRTVNLGKMATFAKLSIKTINKSLIELNSG